MKLKNMLFLLPIFVWFSIVCVEWYSLFFQFPKPMYFRAWEYVLNEGKDSYYVPFKPHAYYSGKLSGDLLNAMNFISRPSEIYYQTFRVDEYGFRNDVGIMRKPIDGVLLGTSFVGGAHETQQGIINELLLEKYGIRTYNYATLPLQHFWEDERFIKNPPKYAIIIGSEAEILQNSWIEVLQDTNTTHAVPAWKSTDEWERVNNPFTIDIPTVSKYTKRFSITKHYSQELFKQALNTFLTREQIAYEYVHAGQYDPIQDMIFFELSSYDPRLTDTSRIAISTTIKTLLQTKQVLSKRNIKLIVAVMPSKGHLYASRYKKLSKEQSSLHVLQKGLEDNNINFIDVLTPTLQIRSNPAKPLYFKHDSHWTTIANELIAEKVAEKIEAEKISINNK